MVEVIFSSFIFILLRFFFSFKCYGQSRFHLILLLVSLFFYTYKGWLELGLRVWIFLKCVHFIS